MTAPPRPDPAVMLTGSDLTVEALVDLARSERMVGLSDDALERIMRSRDVLMSQHFNRAAIVFEDLEEEPFLQVIPVIANGFVADRELFVRGLVHKMESVSVAVQERHRCQFHIGLRKLLAGAKAFLLDCAVEQVLESSPDHGARPARRRGRKENIQDVIGLTFNFDQHLLFQFVCANQCHLFILQGLSPSIAHPYSGDSAHQR